VKTAETVVGSERILRSLLSDGPATATDLAARLGLTGTAVRKHLDSLVEAGSVQAGDRAPFGPSAIAPTRLRRGRPAKVFSVTAQGRRSVAVSQDELALDALRFIFAGGGSSAVQSFAAQRLSRVLPADQGPDAGDFRSRLDSLVKSLDEAGFSASISGLDAGGASDVAVQLCQHQCPVAGVAEEFPEFCDAEAAAFEAHLGVHVTRLATIARGDAICTTLIPISALQHQRNVALNDDAARTQSTLSTRPARTTRSHQPASARSSA